MRASFFSILFVRRPGRPVLDPFRERVDRFRTQLRPLLRHARAGAVAPDRVDEQTRLGIAWYDRGTILAAFDERFARIDPQPAVFIIEMALAARVEQDRAD